MLLSRKRFYACSRFSMLIEYYFLYYVRFYVVLRPRISSENNLYYVRVPKGIRIFMKPLLSLICSTCALNVFSEASSENAYFINLLKLKWSRANQLYKISNNKQYKYNQQYKIYYRHNIILVLDSMFF